MNAVPSEDDMLGGSEVVMVSAETFMMAATTPPIDVAFWRDRLEVACEDVLELYGRADFVVEWGGALKPRYRSMLLGYLELPTGLSAEAARDAILGRRERLLLPLLVDAATTRKRATALLDVARGALSDDELARCALPGGDYDRRAVAWLLYEKNRSNLELVFHRDRVERYGFQARVLPEKLPLPKGLSVERILVPSNVQPILDHYEGERRTGRQSVCAATLRIGTRHVLFIKREDSRAFLSKGVVNTFGFRREWIILDFEADLGRVRIASTSTAAPVALADAIASACFGTRVTYEAEVKRTHVNAVDAFLERATSNPAQLSLLEICVRGAPFAGSPKVTIAAANDTPVTTAAQQLSLWAGEAFASAENVTSMKVFMFEKRVRLTVAPLDRDHVLVRYADHVLSSREREIFERHMREVHDIHVLPREGVSDAA